MVKTFEMTSTMPSNYESNTGNTGSYQVEGEHDSIGSDFSIVSSPPMESIGNGNFNNIVSPSTLTLSQIQSQADHSLEEMHMTIHQLLMENADLKKTVQKDHDAMKSQFEIMLNARDQIEAIMKDQLDKREQAKLCIEQLRAENDKLKESLASAQREKIFQYECQIRETKSALDNQKILYHQLKADNDELLADCNQLKQSYDLVMTEKSGIVADYAELKNKYEELVRIKEEQSFQFVETNDEKEPKSNLPFVSQYEETSYHSIPDQPVQESSSKVVEVNLIVLEQDSEKFEADKAKSSQVTEKSLNNSSTNVNSSVDNETILQLQTQLENEKLKVEELAKRVMEQNTIIDQLSEQKNKHQALEIGYQDSERKFAVVNSYLQKYKDRCDSLETWCNVYQGKLDAIDSGDENVLQAKEEVVNLKKLLEDAKQQGDEDKKQLEAERTKNATLLAEHLQLQNTWDTMFQQDSNRSSQTEAYHCLQIRALQEREDAIHARVVLLEEKVKDREDEIERLKTELENIPILQAQLEVYRSDFQEERRCREEINAAKEQLEQEVRRLRTNDSPNTNTTLINNDDEWTIRTPNAPEEETIGEDNAVGGVVPGPNFICPKCNFVFDSFQPLLNHVNTCLDSDQ